jgi:DNA transformation protein and related proteins
LALDDPVHIRELFSAFGPVSVRRMFGGAGLYADGVMFALQTGGEIFLKADDETIPALKAEGSKPFSYQGKRKRVVMSFWRLPNRLLDDPDELAAFARAALAAAHRAAAKKSLRPNSKKQRRSKLRRRAE